MKNLKNRNWLAWNYLAAFLDDFFDFYSDDEKFPLSTDQAYDLIQFIISKEYEK